MVTNTLKTFSRAAIVLAAVVLAPTAPGVGSRAAAQAPGGMPAGAEVASIILQDNIATLAFEQSVGDYAALHRLLEVKLPALDVSTDMRVVHGAMDALAGRIQVARKDARQGDVFTPPVARMFRRRILMCLGPEDMEAVLAEHQQDEAYVVPPLQANTIWPPQVPFNFMPPQLLAALPPLPPELQYRIIGRSLVLWDHHANLIVDFLQAALTT